MCLGVEVIRKEKGDLKTEWNRFEDRLGAYVKEQMKEE